MVNICSFFIGIFCSFNLFASTVLITSATSFFGEEISLALAADKLDLILVGRNHDKLVKLKNNILLQHKDTNISLVLVDFSDIADIKKNIQQQQIPHLDGVVVIGPRPELTNQDIPEPNEWQKAFNQTFIAPVELVKQIMPKISDKASIVVISGYSSKNYFKLYPNTNVIRLMWTGQIKNLMHLFAKRKIRVNAISPGPILTEFHQNKITKLAMENNITFAEQLDRQTSDIPLGTYGTVEDVANTVKFLLGKQSRHINGTNMVLDGGETSTY